MAKMLRHSTIKLTPPAKRPACCQQPTPPSKHSKTRLVGFSAHCPCGQMTLDSQFSVGKSLGRECAHMALSERWKLVWRISFNNALHHSNTYTASQATCPQFDWRTLLILLKTNTGNFDLQISPEGLHSRRKRLDEKHFQHSNFRTQNQILWKLMLPVASLSWSSVSRILFSNRRTSQHR